MAEWNYDHDNDDHDDWDRPQPGTAEFDLESALGDMIERDRLGAGVQQSQFSVPTFGIASDGSRTPSIQNGHADDEDVHSGDVRSRGVYGDLGSNVLQPYTGQQDARHPWEATGGMGNA